jgi:hypothetical protein
MQKGLGIYIGHALQATCSENRHQPLLREAVATTEMRHQFQKHGSITTETSALSVKNLCDGTATVTAAALVLHAPSPNWALVHVRSRDMHCIRSDGGVEDVAADQHLPLQHLWASATVLPSQCRVHVMVRAQRERPQSRIVSRSGRQTFLMGRLWARCTRYELRADDTSAPRQKNAPRTPRNSKWVFSSLALVRRRVLLSLRGQVWSSVASSRTDSHTSGSCAWAKDCC